MRMICVKENNCYTATQRSYKSVLQFERNFTRRDIPKCNMDARREGHY